MFMPHVWLMNRLESWVTYTIYTIKHCTIDMFDTMHNAIFGSELFEHCSLYNTHHWLFWWHCLKYWQSIMQQTNWVLFTGLSQVLYSAAISEPFRTVATTVDLDLSVYVWVCGSYRREGVRGKHIFIYSILPHIIKHVLDWTDTNYCLVN